MLARWIKFFKVGVWKIPVDSLPPFKAFWIRLLRVLLLSIRGFTKSQIQDGASSLTYYSLLALVPIGALFIGISRGFALEGNFKELLLSRFPSQKQVILELFEIVNTSLQQAKGGLITGLGVLLLFWSAIKILSNIEYVMNDIWEVQKSRSLAKKFSDYLAMMVLCPLLLLASSSLTVYLSARITALGQHFQLLEEVGPVLFPLLNLTPYLIICGLFTFLYIFIPNTNVRFKPAIYAGLIAGILYQIIQWFYLAFQIGVTSYNAIYGTFAALPLFLIWLHLSWVIFLLGAKTAFALQNVGAYEFITEDFSLSHRFRSILALRIAHLCIKDFCKGVSPPSTSEISKNLYIPLVLCHHLLVDLVHTGILSEVQREKDQEISYQPALDVDQLTIKRVLDMIDDRGQSIPLPRNREVAHILKSLESFSASIERSDANVLLKDI